MYSPYDMKGISKCHADASFMLEGKRTCVVAFITYHVGNHNQKLQYSVTSEHITSQQMS